MTSRMAWAVVAMMGVSATGALGQSAGPSPTNLAGIPNPGDVTVTYNAWSNTGGVLTVGPLAPQTFYSGTSDLTLPQIAFTRLSQVYAAASDFQNFNIIYPHTDVGGVAIFAAYAHSAPTITATGLNFASGSLLVEVPCLSSGNINDQVSGSTTANAFTPSATGREYAVFFNDASPQAAYQDYVAYVNGNGRAQAYGTAGTPTGAQFRNDVSSCATASATNPLVGNPQSLQFSFIDQALSAASLGSLSFDQPPNLVGVEYGRTALNGQDGNQVNAVYQRAFRIIPGSRALLVVSLPFTFYDVKGGQQFRGVGAVGLQYPVTPNWTVEPRLAYGAVSADDQHTSGQSASATVTSQYALYGLGRGRLTLGAMVGYTQVTDVRMAGLSVSRHPGNFVTRDGLAYEYPLKTQLDGRSASLRASYTYTYVDGPNVFLSQSHDVALSVGVRTREAGLKNSYELLRVGLRGELGDKYDAVYLFGGYRF